MTRDDLIKLAQECHWHMTTGGYLVCGLVMIRAMILILIGGRMGRTSSWVKL